MFTSTTAETILSVKRLVGNVFKPFIKPCHGYGNFHYPPPFVIDVGATCLKDLKREKKLIRYQSFSKLPPSNNNP